MNLIKAYRKAVELKNKYGLTDWNVDLITSNTVFGTCCVGKKLIQLSSTLIEVNDGDEVIDTILHEIAHALTPADSEHGIVWKLKCKELGCFPLGGASSKRDKFPKKERFYYKGICVNCNKTWILRKNVQYTCDKCKSLVRLIKIFGDFYQLVEELNSN